MSPASHPVRTLIVDDHPCCALGLGAMLRQHEEICVVGYARDGREAVILHKRLGPDVILMDAAMPEMSGLEAARSIVEQDRSARIIVLAEQAYERDLWLASHLMLPGFLLKTITGEELARSILHVHRGGQCHPFLPGSRWDQARVETRLSKREAEVLDLMRRGLSNDDLATALGVSVNTVLTHVRSISEKLNAGNRTEAVARGFELGYLRFAHTGRSDGSWVEPPP